MPAALFSRISIIIAAIILSIAPTARLFAQHDSPDFVPSDSTSAPIADVQPRPLPAHLVVVRFPAEMLAGILDHQIDITTPVNDLIFGTPVTGLARLVGEPRVDLCPSSDEARFKVVITGTVYSRTIGHGGQATVRGHSITHFTATKDVIYEPGIGFRSLPPQVVANTECYTDSIAPSRGGIVGRIIQRRAGQQIASQHSQLTTIARQRATRRIETAFENRLNERIAQLNEAVDFQVQLASLRTRDGTRRLMARTTSQFLELADAIETRSPNIVLPPRQSTAASAPSIEIWVRSSLLPEQLGDALQTLFTNPDESAILNALAVLPGTLGKQAAAVITALGSENKVRVQNLGEWLVIDLNPAGKASLASKSPAESSDPIRR